MVVSEMVDISILHLFDMEPILQPGMVTTDLLMSGATTKQVLHQFAIWFSMTSSCLFSSNRDKLQAKFFINILAEPPEVVITNLCDSLLLSVHIWI